MIRSTFLAASVTIAAFTSNPVFADPIEDATVISEISVTHELFEGAISAQTPLILAAMQGDFAAQGIQLSNPDLFLQILTEEMVDEFVVEFRKVMVPAYADNFTEQELAEIRAFYETPAGKSLVDKSPMLMAVGAQQGAVIGERAAINAQSRIANRIKTEGIEITEPGMLDKLLDALQ